MDLLQVDINQCDDKFYQPNAFKDTHKCDRKTSYVSRLIILLNMIISDIFINVKYYKHIDICNFISINRNVISEEAILNVFVVCTYSWKRIRNRWIQMRMQTGFRVPI